MKLQLAGTLTAASLSLAALVIAGRDEGAGVEVRVEPPPADPVITEPIALARVPLAASAAPRRVRRELMAGLGQYRASLAGCENQPLGPRILVLELDTQDHRARITGVRGNGVEDPFLLCATGVLRDAVLEVASSLPSGQLVLGLPIVGRAPAAVVRAEPEEDEPPPLPEIEEVP